MHISQFDSCVDAQKRRKQLDIDVHTYQLHQSKQVYLHFQILTVHVHILLIF